MEEKTEANETTETQGGDLEEGSGWEWQMLLRKGCSRVRKEVSFGSWGFGQGTIFRSVVGTETRKQRQLYEVYEKEVPRSKWHFRRLFWNWYARKQKGEAVRRLLQASWVLWACLEKKRQMGGSMQALIVPSH